MRRASLGGGSRRGTAGPVLGAARVAGSRQLEEAAGGVLGAARGAGRRLEERDGRAHSREEERGGPSPSGRRRLGAPGASS